jgi:hypothetical protein
VVFADDASCVWLQLLRRGFRHCFVVMRAGSVWLACEPLKDRIELDVWRCPRIRPRRLLRCTGPPGAAGSPPTASTAAAIHAGASDLRDGCETVARHPCASVWTPWHFYAHLTAPSALRLVSVDAACGSRSSAMRAIRSALTPRVLLGI